MTPIYFPNTYLTDEVFHGLSMCFDKVTIYQPVSEHIPDLMEKWRQSGKIEIRFPAREVEAEIREYVKSYRSFRDSFGGRKEEMPHFRPPDVPFFDNTSSFKIQTDICRQLARDNDTEGVDLYSKMGLIQAALFLQMAQEYDSKQDEINKGLMIHAQMENKLFQNLKGDDDALFQEIISKPLPSGEPPEELMLKERLAAWTRFFYHDIFQYRTGPALSSEPIALITTSAVLFEEMTSPPINIEKIFSATHDHIIHPSFKETLSALALSTDKNGFNSANKLFRGIAPPVLKIAVAVDLSPASFLSKYTQTLIGKPAEMPFPKPQPNTIIGLILI